MNANDCLADVLQQLLSDIRAQQDRLTMAEWVKLMALEANLVMLRSADSGSGR